MPKVLIVTLKFPFPMTGACEIDCATGILQFQRLGFGVKVIAKIAKHQTPAEVFALSQKLGIEMTPITYKFDTKMSRIKKLKQYIARFFTNPLILDGAAFEYVDSEMKHALEDKITNWHPDLVWFDCTQMWPLYGIVKKYKIPIVTRSQNFEPIHFLEENGYSPVNFIRFFPKFIGELIAVRRSDLILPVSAKEVKFYKILGAKKVVLLPTRGLMDCLQSSRVLKEKEKLNVFYMGSTYNVFHMRRDLKFILKEIAPEALKRSGNNFIFHIFGGKFPKECQKYLGENVIHKGYVDDLPLALEEMDIALIPALCGAGQKKKVFEPLSRGFPTVTSKQGLAGYPFENNRDVLLAAGKEEFVDSLIRLQDINLRKKLSQNALEKSRKLFSQKELDSTICAELTDLISRTGK